MTVPTSTLGAVALGAEDAVRAVAAVKAQLRSDGTGEDALIEAHLLTALGVAERFIGAAGVAREMHAVLAPSRGWQSLPGGPVLAITEVEALAPDGSAAAIPADRYAIDIDMAGVGWIRVPPIEGVSRVRATYRAGLAEGWDALPAPIRQGAVLLAVHLFDGRGAEAAPPAAVAALWRPWRRMRLAGERRVA